MSSPEERLLDIAKRLDELAEEGPSELVTLSEELGAIAAEWPEKPKPADNEISEFARRIAQMVEHEVDKRIFTGRYGNPNSYLSMYNHLRTEALAAPMQFKWDGKVV